MLGQGGYQILDYREFTSENYEKIYNLITTNKMYLIEHFKTDEVEEISLFLTAIKNENDITFLYNNKTQTLVYDKSGITNNLGQGGGNGESTYKIIELGIISNGSIINNDKLMEILKALQSQLIFSFSFTYAGNDYIVEPLFNSDNREFIFNTPTTSVDPNSTDSMVYNDIVILSIMNNAGFDVVPFEMDLSSRESIFNMIDEAKKYGPITMLVNGAGVSPSQAPIEAILNVDLYGTAVLLEEVGKVIEPGGVGVTISSQSGFRMKQLTPKEDEQLACTPTEELLNLDLLKVENIQDTLHAYQLAKRCNEKRVMAQSVKWGEKGARINAIAPGIVVTPLAIDEFNGPRGDFYKNMFASCPAGRPATADEIANVAELLMSDKGAFITGSTFLIDGGATASYYYGPLQPKEK